MAISESIRNSDNRNLLSRRSALRSTAVGTAALGAVVLPVGAVIAVEQPAGTDPHIGWWAELKRLDQAVADAIYSPGEDELIDQQCALENLIVGTAPTTAEAAAIIATVLLHYQEESPGVQLDLDADAGRTLARYFLAGMPPAVLQRAGLEA